MAPPMMARASASERLCGGRSAGPSSRVARGRNDQKKREREHHRSKRVAGELSMGQACRPVHKRYVSCSLHDANFSQTRASLALASATPSGAIAAMGPNDKFDLLIKGGEVLDPSQSLRGKRDVGIRYGVIEAVAEEIPAARALRLIDGNSKLVTPGLRDLHFH